MKIDLIDRNKYWKDLLYAYDDVSMELDVLDRQPSVSAIPIPKGATNGDMIVAVFKPHKVNVHSAQVQVYLTEQKWQMFGISWWNAPYKKEVEE